ncbi:predicted protein [Naegleria gruberi]|uniref:Predicted protein n=1 Tax=Naegleria gruberi TaxID=5762 RepID=D2VF53_NAEGR|nr:uncharacterized protein NAEGRDRAFT_49032 [Naegleria gruberi]EFC44715.1 predicted protein [Naegleria gruberi]|eukprot:XP_002677459.1 predicted protein [Naegleria gruberi strain NEG-M]
MIASNDNNNTEQQEQQLQDIVLGVLKRTKDREFVLNIVKQNGLLLTYADESFKKDREIVLEAVKQNGLALQCADESLRKDREIILEAVKGKETDSDWNAAVQYGLLLKYADESLKKDRQFLLQVVVLHEFLFDFADQSLKKDRNFVLNVVKQNGKVLEYVDESFKKDREFVLEAVKQNGNALQRADESFKKDREIVLEAVKQNRLVLEHVDNSFKGDIPFIFSLFKHNTKIAKEFSPSITKSIEDCVDLHRMLSTNIIELYSKKYLEEKDLYFAIELSSLFNPKSKSALFNYFNQKTYSPLLVEKLITFQILKQMNHEELSNNIPISESANFHLFCFRLDNFLKDNPSQTTDMKDLKNVVENVSSNFKTSFYSTKEIMEIMSFVIKWFESEQTFENYKQILCKYNELRGDLAKIFKALNYYYIHFKMEYDFISVLGYGAEGVVFKVFHKKTKSLRAMKFKYDPEGSEAATNYTINLLKRTDIEGKIKCFECAVIQNHLYSVMELGEESLSHYIYRNNDIYRDTFLTKDKLIELFEIFTKVLRSVKSIHDHNIAHRDLDPQNIVKIGDTFKIIDFETSRVIKIGHSITIARGKYAYMSPEVSHDNYTDNMFKYGDNDRLAHNIGQITTSSDIFSLGCIFLKLLTNCPLQLDEKFVTDPDVSKYNNGYPYFSGYGKYFYTVITTTEGEMKLHYAIEKLINHSIDPEVGINELLIRCIITMIQRDSTKILNCYLHLLIIENILKFLRGEIKDLTLNITNEIEEFKKIMPLKSYSQLAEEVDKITFEKNKQVKELLERNKIVGRGNYNT